MKLWFTLGLISILSSALPAQDVRPTTVPPAPTAPAPVLPRKPAYKPPKVDAPAVRVAGGSRGGNFDGVVLQALVPDHAARTISAAPALYWFQSKPAKARFEISITVPGQAKSVLQRTGDGQRTAGIHRIDLASEKDANGKAIELKPGVEYRWTVALVPDNESRSKDIIAGGVVQRVEATKELQEKLETATPAERACILAENGLWYDAFALLSQLSGANAKDGDLRNARADLLAAIGLKEAAEAARR
jgi:hypothetical protein